MKSISYFLLLIFICNNNGFAEDDVRRAKNVEDPSLSTRSPKLAEAEKSTYELLEESLNFATKARDLLSEQVISISDNIDAFIGSERASDEINGSHLRIQQSNTVYKDGSIEHNATAKFKLDLPRTNKRLSLVIESDTDNTQGTERDNQIAPQTQALDNQDLQNTAINTAIQWVIKSNENWHLRTQVGIQLHGIAPNPNTKFRIRRLFVFTPWEFRITETLFWYRVDGIGETTQFDLERPLAPGFFFRATNRSTWFRDTRTVNLSQTLTVFQDIGKNRLLSYQLAAYANTAPEFHATAYSASVNYRQLIYLDWLYLQVTPTAIFSRSEDFDFVPAITFTFEAIIGAIKKSSK